MNLQLMELEIYQRSQMCSWKTRFYTRYVSLTLNNIMEKIKEPTCYILGIGLKFKFLALKTCKVWHHWTLHLYAAATGWSWCVAACFSGARSPLPPHCRHKDFPWLCSFHPLPALRDIWNSGPTKPCQEYRPPIYLL